MRFVLNKKEREQIIKSRHAAPTSGHLGTKKTLARITERFLWPVVAKAVYSMVSDACSVSFLSKCKKKLIVQIETCDVCQRTSRKLNIVDPELHPVPVVSPWHHIGVDFIGLLLRSSQGCQYILTISDYFSKYVLAIPIRQASFWSCCSSFQGKIHIIPVTTRHV